MQSTTQVIKVHKQLLQWNGFNLDEEKPCLNHSANLAFPKQEVDNDAVIPLDVTTKKQVGGEQLCMLG